MTISIMWLLFFFRISVTDRFHFAGPNKGTRRYNARRGVSVIITLRVYSAMVLFG